MPSAHKIKTWSFGSVYFLCLLLNCLHAYQKPEYNWDVLPYMAVIKSYAHESADIHDSVYAIAKNEIPGNTFKSFIDSNNSYRWKAAKNKSFFCAQLEFYRVKPLYTGASFLFFKAGFPLTKSTVLPSILTYLLIAGLLFFWIFKYLELEYTFLVALLLMFSPPLMQAVRLSTPDSMVALFIFSAIYFLIEKQSVLLFYGCMLLAILSRIDSIIPCIFILSALAFTGKWRGKLRKRTYFFMIAGAVMCFMIAPYIFSSHSLRIASFFEHLKTFNDTTTGFAFRSYIDLVKSQAMSGLYYSSLLLFLFIVVLMFLDTGFRPGKLSFEQVIALVMVCVIVFRFILQPVVSDRFYISYYLCIAVLLVRKLSLKIYP